jgi:hypothetical protein
MTTTKMKAKGKPPEPVSIEVMHCFAIAWFETKYQADKFERIVKKGGRTYLGGAFHGRPCGRDEAFDKEHEGKLVFAVTFNG